MTTKALNGARYWLAAAALMCTHAAWGAESLAATYPSRPVRIIVPFVPGGPSDYNARLMAQRLTEAWSQQFVVDNRPGAGGLIGTELAARANADGYTLVMGNPGPLTIAPSVQAKMPFQPLQDLAPVIVITTSTSFTTVNANVPVKSVQELIALAKAKPGDLKYGTPGVGTVGHMTMELFDHMAGTKTTHVPYKGIAAALTDLLSGQLQISTLNPPMTLAHSKTGKIRVVAFNGLKRSAHLPDVPTMDEQGLRGFHSTNWNSVLAPAKTSREIVLKLNREINARVLTPDTIKVLVSQGYEPGGGGPEVHAEQLKADTAKWARVAKVANVRLD
jgi:tripartite-type tricarboxylate transporter receptor subunit TctC